MALKAEPMTTPTASSSTLPRRANCLNSFQNVFMIPAYDFCVPDKESQTAADDPCTLFQKIKFPTDEFFPPKLTDLTIDK